MVETDQFVQLLQANMSFVYVSVPRNVPVAPCRGLENPKERSRPQDIWACLKHVYSYLHHVLMNWFWTRMPLEVITDFEKKIDRG